MKAHTRRPRLRSFPFNVYPSKIITFSLVYPHAKPRSFFQIPERPHQQKHSRPIISILSRGATLGNSRMV